MVRWMNLNQEVTASVPVTHHLKKICLYCREGILPNVVLDNDHLLLLDYEYGILNDRITAFNFFKIVKKVAAIQAIFCNKSTFFKK